MPWRSLRGKAFYIPDASKSGRFKNRLWIRHTLLNLCAEFLASGQLRRLKACANERCRWVFLDETKGTFVTGVTIRCVVTAKRFGDIAPGIDLNLKGQSGLTITRGDAWCHA